LQPQLSSPQLFFFFLENNGFSKKNTAIASAIYTKTVCIIIFIIKF